MLHLIDIILRILATYRVTRMLAYEDGPGDVFVALRTYADACPAVARGLHCPLCLSFWLALAVGFLPDSMARWLGIAGGVALIHRLVDGDGE